MIRPKSVNRGDKIAIISPASSTRTQYVHDAVEILRGWGLEPVIYPHCLTKSGTYSATVEDRVKDLKNALADDSVRAIIASRGGYGVVHLLSHVPNECFTANPKWIIGFSDISVLHSASVNAGVMSLHAPMCKHLAVEGAEQYSSEALRRVLFGENVCYQVAPHKYNKSGEATAPLYGGNLAVLTALMGTRYDIFQNEMILFIEDIGESIYRVERMLYHLRLAGVFEHVKGLIVGRFTDYKEDMNFSCMEDMINAFMAPYNFPVSYDFPVGHVSENYALIEGAEATLTVTENEVKLKF